jgi:hypothetical protein
MTSGTEGTAQNGPPAVAAGIVSGTVPADAEARSGLALPALHKTRKIIREMMLAVRQGFEPWVQVLARTTV